MLRVDTILFSNVTTSIQRTAHLTGGAVRGLPGGVVIEGLKGINSFSAEMAEAQKEYKQGRVTSALQRVRQMEMQFNGIAGRWNSSVGSIITSARQGRQNLPAQKLTALKNAQAAMLQLTGPVSKTFRDLISALDHAVSSGGENADEQPEPANQPEQSSQSSGPAESEVGVETPEAHAQKGNESQAGKVDEPARATPDASLLGNYGEKYDFDRRLALTTGPDKKMRLTPRIQAGKFYFFEGFSPACVVRVREIHRDSVLIYNTHASVDVEISTVELKMHVRRGIWSLNSR